jgi:hypothetical protein
MAIVKSHYQCLKLLRYVRWLMTGIGWQDVASDWEEECVYSVGRIRDFWPITSTEGGRRG